ncbi:MAG: hypothetical protein P8Q36_16800 [Alphaproteobacteria bacterium]|jgi:hypothetical protein|nr:hypothetical protein [Rhodospirillaceae bacterium]MBT7613343.1 hypothetical protein [Rhodospirillaceae bacterium]MBT7646133.1 hypothetical protein [Rhodospirillaceae bacterium]MDG2482505.1 hypothetical protein [Alphaproteobacteria bacterium]
MKRTLTILALSLLIAACQTTRTTFFETAKWGYRQTQLTWTTGFSSTVYVRILERNGFVAYCSYVVSGSPVSHYETESAFFAAQNIYVEGLPIGSGNFMQIHSNTIDGPIRSACVETDIAWNNDFIEGEITMDGARRIAIR